MTMLGRSFWSSYRVSLKTHSSVQLVPHINSSNSFTVPRQSKRPSRVQTPPISTLDSFADRPPLSPLSRDQLFNRNGGATYGMGGISLISSAIHDLDSEGIRIEWNYDDLRSMVTRLIESREMKVVELQRALHVSPKDYCQFVK